MEPIKLIFICTGNSCRSQMAEGLAQYMGSDRVIVYSAGSHPSGTIAERSFVVMNELGINITGQRSEGMDDYIGDEFDYVITLCDNANETCPNWAGMGTRLHWSIPDPFCAGGSETDRVSAYRQARNQIYQRLLGWFKVVGIEPKKLPKKAE